MASNYEAIVAMLNSLPPGEKQQLQAIVRDIDRRLREAGV